MAHKEGAANGSIVCGELLNKLFRVAPNGKVVAKFKALFRAKNLRHDLRRLPRPRVGT